jgi:hypothetical protein
MLADKYRQALSKSESSCANQEIHEGDGTGSIKYASVSTSLESNGSTLETERPTDEKENRTSMMSYKINKLIFGKMECQRMSMAQSGLLDTLRSSKAVIGKGRRHSTDNGGLFGMAQGSDDVVKGIGRSPIPNYPPRQPLLRNI